LLGGADWGGERRDEGGRVCGARRAADAGAVRPVVAGSARRFPARHAGGSFVVDGEPPVLCGFAAGDRTCARTTRALARLRPRPLGPDARPCDRPSPGRDDHGSNAVLRPRALWRGALRTVTPER